MHWGNCLSSGSGEFGKGNEDNDSTNQELEEDLDDDEDKDKEDKDRRDEEESSQDGKEISRDRGGEEEISDKVFWDWIEENSLHTVKPGMFFFINLEHFLRLVLGAFLDNADLALLHKYVLKIEDHLTE